MACSLPPELTDEQIDSALEGTASPEVLAHLAACPACTERLAAAKQAAQRIEALLNDRLAYWDCPTPQVLGDFHFERLAPDDARAVTDHVKGCTTCRMELAALEDFLQPAPAFRERMKPVLPGKTDPQSGGFRLGEWVASLLAPTGMMPALAARGGLDETLVAVVDGRTIFLEFEPAGETQLQLRGQLAADDLADWNGALVEVRQADTLQTTGHVNDVGAFLCAPLNPGPATLRITTPKGLSIIVPELDLPAPEN